MLHTLKLQAGALGTLMSVSGFIAARVLKDDWQTAEIPVVMLTSLDAASDRYWAGQAGVDRYLTKDFEAGELSATGGNAQASAGTGGSGMLAEKRTAPQWQPPETSIIPRP